MSSVDHGSRARYVRGCRCDDCRRANADYSAALRAQASPRPPIRRLVPPTAVELYRIRIAATNPSSDHESPTAWMADAACRGMDPDLFFPEGRGADTGTLVAEAKAVCRRCPVMQECRDYAVAENIVHGVWGGLSPRGRRGLRVEGQRRSRREARA